MSQITIVTTPTNSGQGTPLATAFNDTNSNFTELYARYQVTPPTTLIGKTGDKAGMYASDATYFYYCFDNYDGVSIIWAQVSQVANVSVSLIQSGSSNVKVVGSSANVTVGVTGIPNIATFATTGFYVSGIISTTGNVRGNYILGNGSQLTGLPATYTDSNVTALLSNFGGNVISSTGTINSGNITASNLNTAGNVTGNYILGNGSLLTGLPILYANSNVATLLANFGSNTILTTGNITGSNVNGTNLYSTGLVSATGNVTGGNITTLGNVNAQGIVSATGNIVTSGYFVGTFVGNVTGNFVVPGSDTQVIFNTSGNADAVGGFTYNKGSNTLVVLGVISAQGNVIGGNITTAGQVSATGNITGGNLSATNIAGTLTTASQTNITSVGTLGAVSVSGNITGGNIATAGQINVVGNATIGNLSAGIYTGSSLSVIGVVTAASVVGGTMSGASLSVTGNVAGASLVGTLVTPTQTAITSVGTLVSLSVTGNIDSGNLRTAGNVSAIGNIAGGNIKVTDVEAGGNISATRYTGTTISVVGNITGGNINTSTAFSSTGNIAGGNILTTGYVSATGNVAGNYFIGNGSQLTGIAASYNNANVTTLLANFGSNSISSTGTVTASSVIGGVITGASLSVTGNVIGSGISTSGNISVLSNHGIISSNVSVTLDSLGEVIINPGYVTSPGGLDFYTASPNNYSELWLFDEGNAVIGTAGETYNWIFDTAGNLSAPGNVSATGNITAGNLAVGQGTITVGNIVNANANGIGNVGSTTQYFDTVFAKATSAQYADLAEIYTADAEYAPGTVVVFGGDAEITTTTEFANVSVAGAISTNPAYLMNSATDGLPVALRGRVPVKVVGPVHKGDLLVTANDPGYAISIGQRTDYPLAVFAKSIETNTDEGVKVITAVIV